METSGRAVKNFDEEVWRAKARAIVFKGNVAKFTQNPDLREYLNEGSRNLVEASPTDAVWGIGRSVEQLAALDSIPALERDYVRGDELAWRGF